MNFREKLKSMTGKQVLAAMIDGLENPVGEVSMASYGHVKLGVCYGCAATNAICQISNTKENYFYGRDEGISSAANTINSDRTLLNSFESAINSLRVGDIASYNWELSDLDLENLRLPQSPVELPVLNDYNYKEDLIHYKAYHDSI